MQEYPEGQRLLGSDGQIYVVQGGVPTPVGGTTNVSAIVAPSPVRMALEAQERAREEARDARNAADRAADNSRADRALSLQEQTAELTAELKRLQIEKAQGGGNTKDTRDRLSRLNQLVRQINRVQTLYGDSIGTTKGLAGVLDYAPTDANARFDAAGAALSQQGLAAFRVPGTGTVSDRDAMMFDRANLPTAATRDAAIEEQLLGLRSRVEEEMKALGQATPRWGALDDAAAGKPEQRADNEVPDPTTGADLKPPPPGLLDDPGGAAPRTTAAGGDTRTTFDARMSSQIDSLINAGASKATIDAVLKRQDFPILTPSEWTAVQTWRKQNPGKKYYGANISRVDDLSLMQKAAGSDTGAFLAHMGNMGSAGLAGALAGPTGQGALDAMAANSPNASFAGGLVGGATGALGLEAVAAARAPAAVARFAPRFADAAYGGALGFNQAREGEGLSGALWGAGTSALGGAVGQRLVSGVGGAVGGVRDEAVQVLRDRGIPLTAGQALGNAGRGGAAIKKVEDALTSLPVVGNMVDARRREGIQAFNRAAFQDAAAPGSTITATGAEGMGQVRQSVGDAYDRALDPVTIDPTDPLFGADVQTAISAASRIPNVDSAQDAAMLGLQSRLDGAVDPATGMIPGRNFQEAYRGLARTGRERAARDYGHEVGQVMREGQDALGEALERQNPGAFNQFIEANAANRRANVLASALRSGGNQADELITPAQLNRADITSTSRLEGPITSAAGNRPFFDLATAGQRVLPSNLVDSGTATRAMVAGLTTGAVGVGGGGYALGGAEGAAGAGLGATLLLAAGGSRPAQRALVSIIADRPDYARILGQALEDNARIGGSVGAGTAMAMPGGY